ncbi:universal stress protein [Streptomyces beihaiensis]|uniref:Universal stress protein n=1 Tax=Streptomyces beihaiensis TaxID=2984495 RepID=A0ABT3TWK3_9ACTN|nr:universal stress protein [Streptomyces beihaiensis]MCX3060871.1 universal stress protein [Streptomyces beihaiensis]
MSEPSVCVVSGSVVVGVDGSPASVAAARWAADEAWRRGLPLHVLHAGVEDAGSGLPEIDAPASLADAALRELPVGLLREHPTLTVRAHRTAGPPVRALLDAAARAELLVLGSYGLTGLPGVLVGSVAGAVCARAAGPVVLVRAGQETEQARDGKERPVVVAVDLDRPADALFAQGCAAAAARGVPLHVLHARTARESEPDTALRDAVRLWRSTCPRVETVERLVSGHPAHQLVKASDGAALLLVGRHGSAGERLGHVAHAAIRHAACPVAVVAHD